MTWIINKNFTSDIKHNEFYSSLNSLINFKSKEFAIQDKLDDKYFEDDITM